MMRYVTVQTGGGGGGGGGGGEEEGGGVEGELSEDNTLKRREKKKPRNIIKMDQEAKLESVTTATASFLPPKGPGVRLKGIRRELMEKQCARSLCEKIHMKNNPPVPDMKLCSTTGTDFSVDGFVPSTPEPSGVHDYKRDQAISFWSDNHQRIQGVTTAPTAKRPFRKSAHFSTPIGERLDDPDPPYDP